MGNRELFMTDIREARERIWRSLKNSHADSDISVDNMTDSDVMINGVSEWQVLRKGE